MEIYWYHYYDTLWQALTTIGIHGACATILLIILFHTLYHFFIANSYNPYKNSQRKRSRSVIQSKSTSPPEPEVLQPISVQKDLSTTDNNHDRLTITDTNSSNSIIDDLSFQKRRSSTHLNSIPLKTINQTKPIRIQRRKKRIPIAMSIKILTIIYISLILVFSIISFILRVLMIFFNYKIDCLLREHTIEIALLGRICLFVIFSYRLYFSFRESSFSYPTINIIIFTVIAFIITNSTLIYFYMQVTLNRNTSIASNPNTIYDTYSCTKPGFSTTKAILPYFICEFTFNSILVFLFCRKLLKSLRMLLQLTGGSCQMNLQILQTIQLMSKMTLLMSFILISTLLILGIMTRYLSSACISLDNVFNVICMILVFKHNQKYYNLLCCGCAKSCVRFCLCCTRDIRLKETKSPIKHKNKSNNQRKDGLNIKHISLDVVLESNDTDNTSSNNSNTTGRNSCSNSNSSASDLQEPLELIINNDMDDISTMVEKYESDEDDLRVPDISFEYTLSDRHIQALTVIFMNDDDFDPLDDLDDSHVPVFAD